jgi:hypothetical protein
MVEFQSADDVPQPRTDGNPEGYCRPRKRVESRSGFPHDSTTDSVFALMADRMLSRKGAVLLKPAY